MWPPVAVLGITWLPPRLVHQVTRSPALSHFRTLVLSKHRPEGDFGAALGLDGISWGLCEQLLVTSLCGSRQP